MVLMQGIVDFPTKGKGLFPFIGEFVYILIKAMYNNGAIGYGAAIICFTIVLKLILLPLDFTNRYFTKKNANFMAKVKPEEDEIRQQYAGDPMRINRERQALYRKHGYRMGGFCFFMAINLFVTLAVFMSVFYSLRAVANENVRLSVRELQGVYYTYLDGYELIDDYEAVVPIFKDEVDGKTFEQAVNEAYANRKVGFLWIKNIWHQDVPWAPAAMTIGEFVSYSNDISKTQLEAINDKIADEDDHLTEIQFKRMQYNALYENLDSKHKRKWNGLLFLIILAGVTSWASAYITMKMNKSKQQATAPKEKVAGYSMRDVKNQTDAKMPQVDPAMVGRIMMFVLPVIMVFFTMSSTAALAIYIITNSTLSTLINFGMKWPVDKLLEYQEKRKKARGDVPTETDRSVINPHAKYFSKRGGKSKQS